MSNIPPFAGRYSFLHALLLTTLAAGSAPACSSGTTDKDAADQMAQPDTSGVDTGDRQDTSLPSDHMVNDAPGNDLAAGDGLAPLDGTTDSAEITTPPTCTQGPLTRKLVNEPDETFYRGPYLMMVKPDSAYVLWKTEAAQDSRVTVRPAETGETADPLEFQDDTPVQRHLVKLTGLQPDTEYEYQVSSASQTSQPHRFKTAVEQGQPFRFVVWGDSQNNPATFTEIVNQMILSGPHLAVGLGDHVEEGNDTAQWEEQLFHPARALLHQVALYATRGNHEQSPNNFLDAYEYDRPENPYEAATYYSFTYGNAFFVVIESNSMVCPVGDYIPPQWEFLQQAVASPEAQAATWRFAYSHEAAYSEAWGTFEGDLCIRDTVLPVLSQHGFHAYFAGHTHDYERAHVNDMLHIISGGGGGGLDSWVRDFEETKVVYLGHHFLRLDVGCEELKLEAVTVDGTVLDWVKIAPDHRVVDEGTLWEMEGMVEQK